MTRRLTGLVVAGGRSSRFGSDKAAATFLGRPQLEVVCAALAQVCDEIVVVRAQDQPFPDIELPLPIEVARDEHHEQGPLAGIIAGMAKANAPLAVAVSTDVPLLQPDLVRYLASLASDHDVVMPFASGFPQPLVSVYRVEVALPAFEASFQAGNRRIVVACEGLRVRQVPEEELRGHDPELLSFRNANRPEDLAELETIARGR